MSYEIHPETPEKGMLLSERFKGMDISRMFDNLKRSAASYGISIGELSLLSNSRLSLMASEYAKDKGVFHALHEELFKAYFTDARDIGDMEVVLDAGEASGLNREDLRNVLKSEAYAGRVDAGAMEAHRLGINSTPTFIINGKYKIVGAQPLQAFRETLKRIEELGK